jgi:NADPH:quinone reductase-like Zn-dependent oxidoreductase
MPALVVAGHAGGAASLALQQVPVPKPAKGQLLIEVARAPLNPNDLLALKNAYEVPKPLGAVAGFEGSGRVVHGSGFMARMLSGRRVAFSAAAGSGSWARYALAEAMQCAPLSKATSDEQGATMLTNPLTATVLLSGAISEGHRAVVQAAAAGALGKMIARLALARDLPMIHLVRSAAQQQALTALGATEVLDATAPGFEQQLAERCKALHATLALDPVGGAMTGTLLHALDEHGTVRVYGNLSGQPSSLDNDDLVFRGKRVEGFTMYAWQQQTSTLGKVRTVMKVQRQLGGALATEVRATVPLAGFAAALGDYERAMSGGKILFDPTG